MDEALFHAYTAGLFDGEGCIRIDRTVPQSKSTTSPLPRYRLDLTLQMVEIEAIHLIQAYWGGYLHYRVNKRPNQRNSLAWRCAAGKATTFLETILPYLVVKKPHAILGIKFQEHLLATKNLRYLGQGFQRLPLEETVRLRDDFYHQMKVLNKRGTQELLS